MNWKLAPLFILSLAFLYACGGGSGYGGGGSQISVQFLAVPPASMSMGGTTSISAAVTNDSANAGVNWSCAPSGACGSFNPTSTPSSGTTIYTAPAQVPTGGSVTITATSITDPTKYAHATVIITGPTITVQLSQPPPASLQPSATATVAATVTGDSANAGVTWSCIPSSSCGSFSQSATASGATTTYTAPATVPAGAKVTIIATSVTDTTKSAQDTLTIATNISVAFSQAPPVVLSTSATTSIAATVTNDSANAGVTWSCTPAATCGSFNPSTTASGTSTTYIAPATVPTGNSVTIVAASVTDPTKTASAAIGITGTASLATLKGQYAFLLFAPTGLRGTTTWAGSVTLDGNGGVTGGMEDIVSPNYNDQGDMILATSTSGSSSHYSVDSTGHGRLIMSTVNGETLGISFVATSPSHAEVIEADGNGGAGGDPASGTMDLQTGFSLSQISGDYSFTLQGIDVFDPTKPYLALGGEFSAAGSVGITSGAIDVASTAASIGNYAINSGVLTGPDTNGRGTLSIVVSAPNQSRRFVYYIVSSKVLRLAENDGYADTGGSAYLQGTASTTLSGNYVYQHSGWSSTGRTVAAGQFSVTPPGTTLSGGISDSNEGGAPPTKATTATAVAGSYAVSQTETTTLNLTLTDAAGSSTFNAYLVDPSINILDPNSTSGGGGALLMHTDSNIYGTGILLAQQAQSPLVLNYAVNLTNSIAATTPDELDLVGVLAGGTSGLADYDQNDSTATNPMIGASISATLSADAAHAGRYTGSFTVSPPAGGTPYPFIPGTTPPTSFTFSLYQANSSQAFVAETDTQANTMGHVLLQVLP